MGTLTNRRTSLKKSRRFVTLGPAASLTGIDGAANQIGSSAPATVLITFTERDIALSIATPEHERMIRRYVAALSRDSTAVDDLTQEVFVRALERLHRLHNPEDPGPFLRGIARLVVREHFRRRRRDSGFAEYVVQEMSSEEAQVWRTVDAIEEQARLRDAIERLPLVARRMLEMRYHDGLNASQIAERFETTAGAVRVTLLRVRERLRRELGEA